MWEWVLTRLNAAIVSCLSRIWDYWEILFSTRPRIRECVRMKCMPKRHIKTLYRGCELRPAGMDQREQDEEVAREMLESEARQLAAEREHFLGISNFSLCQCEGCPEHSVSLTTGPCLPTLDSFREASATT